MDKTILPRQRPSGRARIESSDDSPARRNAPLNVLTAGTSLWRAGVALHRDDERHFGLGLVCRGSAHYRHLGSDTILEAGDIYFRHPGHSLLVETGPAGCVIRRYVTLGGNALQPMLKGFGFEGSAVLRHVPFARMYHLLRLIRSQVRQRRHDLASVETYRLLSELSAELGSREAGPLARAMDHIMTHLDNALPIADLATRSGVSTPYFMRVFKRYYGVSPCRFITARRIEWAKTLLVERDLSVKQVAGRVGFNDPLYFSRAFTKACGVPPREYRNTAQADRVVITGR